MRRMSCLGLRTCAAKITRARCKWPWKPEGPFKRSSWRSRNFSARHKSESRSACVEREKALAMRKSGWAGYLPLLLAFCFSPFASFTTPLIFHFFVPFANLSIRLNLICASSNGARNFRRETNLDGRGHRQETATTFFLPLLERFFQKENGEFQSHEACEQTRESFSFRKILFEIEGFLVGYFKMLRIFLLLFYWTSFWEIFKNVDSYFYSNVIIFKICRVV